MMSRTRTLLTGCLLVISSLSSQVARAESDAVDDSAPDGFTDAGLELSASPSFHFSPILNGTDHVTVGGGFAVKALHAFGDVYSLGLQLDHFWLYNAEELEVTQQDFLLLNRFWLWSKSDHGLALEVGLGLTRYSGMVDIPDTGAECFGCGRYGDTTYQPAAHAGVVYGYRLHRYLVLQTGVRVAGALSTINNKTDVHNFVPGLVSWNFDAGIAVPLF